ncbi:MAG: hypothetical protein DLM53_11555 [Candidatus Eremiobacter antarcticus]|nr:MAG: hypothetical protein DLM53_11555 [Candidatus Eremiobacter sp. RRmetagenome_bin22]
MAGLLVFVGGSSVTAAPTPVPDMKPDLSSMNYLLGTWKCESTVRGMKRPNTTTYSTTMDGRWILAHDVAPPFDPYRTRAIQTDSWTTYNPLNHLWVTTFVDDFGNYGINTSPGWKGSSMTSTILVANDGTTGHDTLTKLSDTQTKDVAMSSDASGRANPTVTTTCNKQ